jgi:hypothetical protein
MKFNQGSIFAFLLAFVLFTSCKKDSNDESATSSHNGNDSHNAGIACMNCHVSGGSGEGTFNVAGTVYNQAGTGINPNGTIYIYSGANGTGNLLGTIEVDGKGNFYTTASVLPSSGAYVQLKGASGDVHDMSGICNSGNCNSCHGVSTGKIWTN